MIFRHLIILFSLILLLCGCTKRSNEEEPAVQEVTIAHLKSLCSGDHYRITEEYTIRGVVVATDWLGESYRSMTIVDRSGGLEIALSSHIADGFMPIYSEVTIYCLGLMLARIGGKIELGAPPTGDFLLDTIDEEMFGRYIQKVGVCENFIPVTKRFSDIGVADVSAIVRFDNIRICDEEQGKSWCDLVDGALVATFRTFVDRDGNSFAVRTMPTNRYAAEGIPTKEISVVGIIDYADNRYFVRIANGGIIQ